VYTSLEGVYVDERSDEFLGRAEDIQISDNGRVDFHLSCFGLDEELYFTWPDDFAGTVLFRKFNYPANGNGDRGLSRTISGTSTAHRSNVMVEAGGRIWVFTRRGDSPSDNVRYHYSDDDGSSWTSGVAFATGASNVRIGSMPYVGGSPALVVLHIGDSRGYEYYLWDGSSFEARPDHSVYAQNMGGVRAFTHNVVRDTTFHLVFGLGSDLYHVWKHYNGGDGVWESSVIESSPYTVDNAWLPTSAVRGDDLYVFYCRRSSSSFSSSMIYYKRWSQLSETWTDPVLVSTDPDNVGNRDPNTCFQVPESSDYIPVFWNSTTGNYNIYFSRINLNPNAAEDGDQSMLPSETELYENYPNPFNSGTMINYFLADECQVRITVYDALGRVVSVMLDEIQDSGLKSVGWTCRNLPSGVYYYRLRTDREVISRKMTLIK
jgi:hypothetical protein